MELCATCFFPLISSVSIIYFFKLSRLACRLQLSVFRQSRLYSILFVSRRGAHRPPRTNTFAPSAILCFFFFLRNIVFSSFIVITRNINFPLYPNCHSYTSVNKLHLLLSLITSQHAWQAHTQVKVHRSASSADSCVSAH